jgi:hypothetical protein
MTTRQFDPVFSAALRNELEALVDAKEETGRPPKAVRVLLHRPQLWVSLVTAVVLVAATLGVLQLTAPPPVPAQSSKVVDPLSRVTDPSSPGYVARAVQVLLHVRATGPGAHDFDVPSGVTSLRVYLNCAPTGQSAVDIDGDGKLSGECSRESGSTYDLPVKAGAHEVEVTIGKRTDYTLLLMTSPAPTVSAGGLIDPLTAIRDRRNPDALVGDTTPVLEVTTAAGGGSGTSSTPLRSSKRLRAYFVCRTSSSTAEAVVDGRAISGCMNSVAHWFDFTPRSSTMTARITSPGETALLVVPAPKGAKDSPASTVLAYPRSPGTLLAGARGTGAPATGTYRNPGLTIAITLTCRGTGWLEIATGDGGTTTRGNACSTTKPNTIGIGRDRRDTKAQPWTVIPHGDISWTFQLSTDG